MYPIPSTRAAWLFAASALATLIAIVTESAFSVILSTTIWLVLSIAFVATVPLGRHLRRQRLELAWWLDASGSSNAAVAGVPFDVRCFARHRGDYDLDIERIDPITSIGATCLGLRPLRIRKSARTEFLLRVLPAAAGRVVLHGLALEVRGPLGLFRTPLFFPNPLSIRVLPRTGTRRRLRRPRHQTTAQNGLAHVYRRGGGMDLCELREFAPGDAFKSIAWKASARRCRLIVREVEQEVQETTQIIVDAGSSMRGGSLGRRKIDHAVQLTATIASRAISEGDRVGLLNFDGRITSRLNPAGGHGQLIRIYDTLLAEMEVVDADRTSLSEVQLLQKVATYCRQQDGVDFGSGTKIRQDALIAHVRRQVGARGASIIASTAASRALRRFCLERGLALPARTDSPSTKAAALVQALSLAGARSRHPSRIIVITDFDGISSAELVQRVVQVSKRHGHSIGFILPVAHTSAMDDSVDEVAVTIYGRSEQRRLNEAERTLRRIGATVELIAI